MARFEIDIQTADSAPTIRVRGEFDLDAAAAFRAEAERLVPEECEFIVVDLRELTFLDSSGLSELIALYNRTAKLAILRPPPRVARLFELTGLDQHLPLYDPDEPLDRIPRRG